MRFDTESIPEVDFGIRGLRQAANLVEQIRRETVVSPLTKEDLSPVTVADFAVQALVARLLAKAFPHDPLVAEESSKSLKNSQGKEILETAAHLVKQFFHDATAQTVAEWIDRGTGEPSQRFWTMDPIDGTKGFLRGEQFAIALALIEKGVVTVGILACPNLKKGREPDIGGAGTLAVGVRGHGSWHTSLKEPRAFLPLKVSTRREPSEAIFLRSFESRHTDRQRMERVMKKLGTSPQPIFMDSLATYVFLASGIADLLARLPTTPKPQHRECIWDQAPGAIIVQEAGGTVTDFEGKNLDYSKGRILTASRGILVSNTHLHAAALEALREI